MTTDPAGPAPAPAQTPTTTTLSRSWIMKMSIYLLALLGLGAWGLIDAVIVYPARGEKAASFLEKEYLASAQAAGRLLRDASVPDPGAELDRLQAAEREMEQNLASAEQDGRGSAAADLRLNLSRLEWLTALSRIDRLDPANTNFADPSARLTELETRWATEKAPKPLAQWDIPSQWLITGVGFFFAGWIVFLFVTAGARKFRWDPARRAITLPGGKTIAPEDVKEVDKRKWDKFFVTLHMKDGSQHRLDLLRYAHLEGWVLELEKHTDGYEPPVETPAAAAPESENAGAGAA